MPLLLLLTLAAVPLAEIALFIWVGEMIGILPTLILTIGAVVLGAALAWSQGFATLQAARRSLDRGEIPALEILSGAVLLIAAFFLMTPGFITATIGFVLLIRPLRLWIGRAVLGWLIAQRDKGPGGKGTINGTVLRRYGVDGPRELR